MASGPPQATVATAAAVLTVLLAVSVGAAQDPEVVVGPDVAITHPPTVPFVEFDAAADPSAPGRLIVGAMGFTHPRTGVMSTTFRSSDGGMTWHQAPPPAQLRAGGADPQVAFGPDGTAYFVALSGDGPARSAIEVYRSRSDGLTWTAPVRITAPTGVATGPYDHPQMAVDLTNGPQRGTIYLGALRIDQSQDDFEYVIDVFRSTDGGRSWAGPVRAVSGGDRGVQVAHLSVQPDGALLVSYSRFDLDFAREAQTFHASFGLVASHDGARTFSEPREGLAYTGPGAGAVRTRRGTPSFWRLMMPVIVADPRPGSEQRVYALWNDYGDRELPRLLFARSDDRGRSWRTPRPLTPSAPGAQYMGTLAVNRDGVLGALWLDTRSFPERDGYRAYFSASVDGGETFLSPRAISRAPSRPFTPGNVRQVPFFTGYYRDELLLSLGSAASRYRSGGDYLRMATDPDGVFHPVWPDARGAAFQAYTARVRVRQTASPAPPASRAPVEDVSDAIDLIAGAPAYDSETGMVKVEVRLRNVSRDTLYAPLRAEVRLVGEREAPIGVESGDSLRSGFLDGDSVAVYDFTDALGDWASLQPGCATAPVPVRARLVGVDGVLSFKARVFASPSPDTATHRRIPPGSSAVCRR